MFASVREPFSHVFTLVYVYRIFAAMKTMEKNIRRKNHTDLSIIYQLIFAPAKYELCHRNRLHGKNA